MKHLQGNQTDVTTWAKNMPLTQVCQKRISEIYAQLIVDARNNLMEGNVLKHSTNKTIVFAKYYLTVCHKFS